MAVIEIYFKDLSEEKQAELLELWGSNMGYDKVPIVTLPDYQSLNPVPEEPVMDIPPVTDATVEEEDTNDPDIIDYDDDTRSEGPGTGEVIDDTDIPDATE